MKLGNRTYVRIPKQRVKRRVNPTAPTKPGWYYWDEWNANVEVYRKPKGFHLYVTPPNGVEIRVTPNIAGTFKELP